MRRVACGLVLLLVLLAPDGAPAKERAALEPLHDRNLPALLPFGPRRLSRWEKVPVGKPWQRAVERGLDWLAAHQSEDGRWSASRFYEVCRGSASTAGRGSHPHDVGVTGMALAAFLGAGYDHRTPSEYDKVVADGLLFLMGCQAENGCLVKNPKNHHYVYDHAWGALALVEGYALSGDGVLLPHAQNALHFHRSMRNPYFCFRYGVRPGDNDTSVTAAMMMAHYAADRANEAAVAAGFKPPLVLDDEAWDGVKAWIGKMTDADEGRTGYAQRGGKPKRYAEIHGRHFDIMAEQVEPMTAAALVLRARLGEVARKSRAIQSGLALLEARPPVWDPEGSTIDLLYWFEGTHAVWLLDKTGWRAWRKPVEQALVSTQCDTGCCGVAGSWDPMGAWGRVGGRVYATALAVLTLEAPIRYSPRRNSATLLAAAVRRKGSPTATRCRAVMALARVSPKTYGKTLSAVLSTKDVIVLHTALTHIPGTLRTSSKLIQKIGRVVEKHANLDVRLAGLEAIGRAGARAEKALGSLDIATRDEEPRIASAAMHALATLASELPAAKAQLGALLKDRDPGRQALAAAAVLKVDPSRNDVRTMLVEAALSDDVRVRDQALAGLGIRRPTWLEPTKVQIQAAVGAGADLGFENLLGMRFVLIPSGTFTMGSPAGEKDRLHDETPHEVTITRPYYLGVTEATNSEYRYWKQDHRAGKSGAYDFDPVDLPVCSVAHGDALVFAEWLSKEDGKRRYRLPTEAEWEHAARAGTTGRFWWGDDEKQAGAHENVADETAKKASPKGFGAVVESTPGWRFFTTVDGHVIPAPAGSLKPNPWGLYDMLGNVSEWVQDWRGEYPDKAVTDPKGQKRGESRVFRGGSWVASPQQTRAAMRGFLPTPLHPGDPTRYIGFRLVAEVKGP